MSVVSRRTGGVLEWIIHLILVMAWVVFLYEMFFRDIRPGLCRTDQERT